MLATTYPLLRWDVPKETFLHVMPRVCVAEISPDSWPAKVHFGTIWVYRGGQPSLTRHFKTSFPPVFRRAKCTQICSYGNGKGHGSAQQEGPRSGCGWQAEGGGVYGREGNGSRKEEGAGCTQEEGQKRTAETGADGKGTEYEGVFNLATMAYGCAWAPQKMQLHGKLEVGLT